MRLTGNRYIDLLPSDFTSLRNIRELAELINKRYEKLDVLINNAGIFVTRLQHTHEGYELQWGVNHLAHFLLTQRLLGLLEKSTPSRIINVASKGNYQGTINFEDLNLEKKYNGLVAYRQSKLANVLFTFELAERAKDKGITCNCLHPGMIRTTIGHRNTNHWMGWAWMLMKPFMLPVERGAYSIVKLATEEKLNGVTGKYYDADGSEKVPNPMAFDPVLRKKFWEISETLVSEGNNENMK